MMKWLDERLNISGLLASLFEHPVPKKTNFLDYLGFVTLFIFINQALTGILLATVYKPSAAEAYISVKALDDSTVGHFVRSLHSWGANFMVVLVVLHLLRVFFVGAYKRPRELTWVMGGILLVGTIGLAFTGYLLPWDQEGYWATTVGTAMAGYVPLIGNSIIHLLRDGAQVTGATLTRFYSVHMLVLPILILLAFMPHFFFVLRQGMEATDALTIAQKRGEDVSKKSIPFWPNVAFRMSAFILVASVALWICAALFPKELGNAADPLNKAHYIPEPAWYFFGVYQMLKYFPSQLDVLGIVVLPLVAMIILFGLPWLDRNPHREAKKRPISIGITAVLVLSMVFLTYQGMNSAPKALGSTRIVVHPSYAKDIQPILNNSCISCHSGFSTYSNVVQKVTPGDPTNSKLIKRLTGLEQPQMPISQDPLTNNQIETFKNWIKDGAKNN
jgi:ubiquinol-cytochrome c reductase cytochrome b subunit